MSLERADGVHAFPRAGFEQIAEFVFTAKETLKGDHGKLRTELKELGGYLTCTWAHRVAALEQWNVVTDVAHISGGHFTSS